VKAAPVLPAVNKAGGPAAVPPLYSQDLLSVEEQLKQLLNPNQRAAVLGARLALSGGKRLRPRLCLLAYRYSSGNSTPTPGVYKLATAIELLHLATLLHDDVIDNATHRRSEPSVNIIHGNKTAVLLGDFFFSSFLEAAAGSGSDILSLLANTISNMVDGELSQAHHRLDLSLTENQYLAIIERKTAALIAAACEVGAKVARANQSTINSFRRFGHALGCAFQIQDDILDYIGSPNRMGKALYSDLKEGIITLPLIYALEHSVRKVHLSQLLLHTELTAKAIGTIVDEVKKTGGLDYARQQAATYLNVAQEELMTLAPSPPKRELEWLLLTLTKREK